VQNNKPLVAPLSLSRLLWSDLSPLAAYGLAAVLALAFIGYVYPMAFIAGSGNLFENGDASQHVTGWLFYAQDSWRFPLLRTERLNHPEGVSIAFTDSIPLAALLFKPFASWLPPGFHYLGLWHVVALATQAIAATFLIRSLGVRHVLATLAAVFFAIQWPALLFRGMGHTSLMTHGLILCALAFYFLGRHGHWRANTATAAFFVLNLVALTVHPYFLAFCYTLFLAFLADQAIGGEGWKKQLPRLFASLAAIAVTFVVLGYFSKGTTTPGFGYYSMNLVAPVCAGGMSTFYNCGFDGNGGGQGEGFNYFGAGALVMLAFVFITQWSAIKALPKRYPALLAVVILLSVYALSTKVYLSTYKIAEYALPSFIDRFTGTFRSSGRFFWVASYLILFAALAALLKKPSRRAIVLLAIALPLQWMDVQPLRNGLIETVSRPGSDDLAPWGKAMANVDKIHLYPAFGCGTDSPDIYWFFQRVAARHEKLLDTGYIARLNPNCSDNKRAFEGPFQHRHLYVTSATQLQDPAKLPAGFLEAARNAQCAKWQKMIICQAGMTRADWVASGLATEPIAGLGPDTGLKPSTANSDAPRTGQDDKRATVQ
jgi:hypothetical protein